MRNKNGFSLIELLISLIIASIVILTAGALSSISLNSYYKVLSKQETYNDLSYGLKLLRNRFRNAHASNVQVTTPGSASWSKMSLLEIDNAAFGIYQPNSSSIRKFVYLPDKSKVNRCEPANESNHDCETLLTVPDGNIAWTVTCSPSCSSLTSVTVSISGIKKNNSFHMETTIARRNP